MALVGVLAGQRGEPQQPERGRRAARGDRRVLEVLAPRDELLVVVGGREEAALLGVGEALDDRVGERARLAEPARLEGRLVEVQQRLEQERVVLEVGVELRLARVERAQQPPAVVAHARQDEVARRRARRRGGPARPRTAPASASALIISAFQPARRLSSRPGQTRSSRRASSVRAHARAGVVVERGSSRGQVVGALVVAAARRLEVRDRGLGVSSPRRGAGRWPAAPPPASPRRPPACATSSPTRDRSTSGTPWPPAGPPWTTGPSPSAVRPPTWPPASKP